MPYVPVTDGQREDMLHALGIVSAEELFEDFPERLRYPSIDLPPGASESEVLRELSALAASVKTADETRSFLGAGAYDHFIPSVVPYLASRGEFLTAYTPYQAEVSQGTLQAIFEYQSMIAALTGLDAVNASHYDGATALAEAILMALRGGRSRRILLPAGLHPEYRQVAETYLAAADAALEEYDGAAGDAVRGGEAPAAIVVSYPDFFGRVPDLSGVADAAHAREALLIVQFDPIMLGLMKSPGEWGADIAVAEGQCLGNDLAFGGPYLGIMATKNELVRRMPGRIAGEAKDAAGRRGFTLTLAAREQHIRREKAVSNICSNQGLATLRAAIYLATVGKNGLRRVAEICWNRAHFCADRIGKVPGFSVEKGTFFKEFVVKTPIEAEKLVEILSKRGFIPGFPLSRYYPDRKNELLVCVTEMNTRTDIEDLAEALREAAE